MKAVSIIMMAWCYLMIVASPVMAVCIITSDYSTPLFRAIFVVIWALIFVISIVSLYLWRRIRKMEV